VPPAREASTFETPRGRLTVASPAPGVLQTIATGHVDVAMADRIIAAGERVLAESKPLFGFHDWEGLTGYETECRKRLTEWGMRIRADVGAVHVLVRSRLVAMGVSVASLALQGMIVPYTERPPFEIALAAHLRKVRRP
jgi:hypothetical protein